MEKDQTDFNKNLKLLLKRKWLWIIPTIVFSIGATIYALNQPDIYESKCVLIVEESKLLNTVLAERGVAPDTGKILQAISERMLGWESVVKVIKTVGLNKELPEDDPSALEKVYHSIVGQTMISTGGGRRGQGGPLITISYIGVSPELNFKIVDGLVSNFMEQSLHTSQVEAEEAIAFMGEEVDRLKRAFYESERKIRLYQEEHFGELPGNRENILSDLFSAERELASINGEIMTLREKLDFLQERTDEGVLLLTPIASNLNQQIIDLEIHIETLQAKYSDEHPEIIMRKRELAHLKEALARETDKVVTEEGNTSGLTGQEFDLQLQLKSLQRRRGEVESIIATFKESVEGKSELGQEYFELQREYEINKDLYEKRLIQRSNADLAKEISLDEKTNPFTIIEPARISYKPIKANKIKIILMGCIFGPGLGIALIFGLVKIDRRFKTEEEVQEYLQIPALGIIPTILTKTDIRRKIRKRIVMTSLLVVFVVSAITVSFVVQPVKDVVKDVVNDHVTKAIKLVK